MLSCPSTNEMIPKFSLGISQLTPEYGRGKRQPKANWYLLSPNIRIEQNYKNRKSDWSASYKRRTPLKGRSVETSTDDLLLEFMRFLSDGVKKRLKGYVFIYLYNIFLLFCVSK